MSKTRWPREVPVLEPSDLKGYSVLDWCDQTFGVTGRRREKAFETILDLTSLVGIPLCNMTRRQQAHLWNGAMYRLGYTEGNPTA